MGVLMSWRGGTTPVVVLILVGSGCGEPVPPAIVGESDAFRGTLLRPIYASDSDLYFHCGTGPNIVGPVPPPEAGVYQVGLSGGTAPLLRVPANKVGGVELGGSDLIMVTRLDDAAQLTVLPLGAGEATSLALGDSASIAATSSGGYTFVLASEAVNDPMGDIRRMSITRLATASGPELVLTAREDRAAGRSLYAVGGYLYWLEDGAVAMRIADDQSQTIAQEIHLPASLATSIPLTGDWVSGYEYHWLLGVIGDEVYGFVYYESFFPTGGMYENGELKGYYGFGGGGIFTVAADVADARVVAVDIVDAVIAGDALYGQNRDGDIVRIDPITGAVTRLAGHAPIFEEFASSVVNSDWLFYADRGDEDFTYAIRQVSRAPRN